MPYTVAEQLEITNIQKEITRVVTPALTQAKNRRRQVQHELDGWLKTNPASVTAECLTIVAKGKPEGYGRHLYDAAQVTLNACAEKGTDLRKQIAMLEVVIESLTDALKNGYFEPIVATPDKFKRVLNAAMKDHTAFESFIDGIPATLLDEMAASSDHLDSESYTDLIRYAQLRTDPRWFNATKSLNTLAREIRHFQSQDKTNHAEIDKNMTIDAFVSLCRKAERAAVPWDDFVQTAVNSSSYKLLRGCQGNFDKESYSGVRRYFGTSKLFQDRILPVSLIDFQNDLDSQAVKTRAHAQTVAQEKELAAIR